MRANLGNPIKQRGNPRSQTTGAAADDRSWIGIVITVRCGSSGFWVVEFNNGAAERSHSGTGKNRTLVQHLFNRLRREPRVRLGELKNSAAPCRIGLITNAAMRYDRTGAHRQSEFDNIHNIR